MKIRNIHARQILDSRGNPTIEVDVHINDSIWGRASVPSGASTGEFGAVEIRDNNNAYMGKSVLRAVENVNSIIANQIIGMDIYDIQSIDNILIGLRFHPFWHLQYHKSLPFVNRAIKPIRHNKLSN